MLSSDVRQSRAWRWLAAAGVVLAGGIAVYFFVRRPPPPTSEPQPQQPAFSTEQSAGPVRFAHEYHAAGATSTLWVLPVGGAGVSAHIIYSTSSRLVSDWVSPQTMALINAGYFHEDYSPSGFLVVDGGRIGTRMFAQDKSGLVVIANGQVSVRDLAVAPITPGEQFESALQSYPFLIRAGRAAIARDSGKASRRTAIGLDTTGQVYMIVADAYDITLFQLMNELMTMGIAWADVLNLDGGSSSGVAARGGQERWVINSLVPVPMVLEFFKN